MTYELTGSDWTEVRRIADEIIEAVSASQPRVYDREVLRRQIEQITARNIVKAQTDYDAQVTAEETHKWDFGSHHISECQIDWCGRYRGQRRDSATEVKP